MAHGGLFRLTLQDPILHLNDAGDGVLVFHVGEKRSPVPLLEVAATSPAVTSWHTYLTEHGVSVFDDVYRPGEAMADIFIDEADERDN